MKYAGKCCGAGRHKRFAERREVEGKRGEMESERDINGKVRER